MTATELAADIANVLLDALNGDSAALERLDDQIMGGVIPLQDSEFLTSDEGLCFRTCSGASVLIRIEAIDR